MISDIPTQLLSLAFPHVTILGISIIENYSVRKLQSRACGCRARLEGKQAPRERWI